MAYGAPAGLTTFCHQRKEAMDYVCLLYTPLLPLFLKPLRLPDAHKHRLWSLLHESVPTHWHPSLTSEDTVCLYLNISKSWTTLSFRFMLSSLGYERSDIDVTHRACAQNVNAENLQEINLRLWIPDSEVYGWTTWQEIPDSRGTEEFRGWKACLIQPPIFPVLKSSPQYLHQVFTQTGLEHLQGEGMLDL